MQAEGGLVHASNGFIYGVTDRGGSFSFGTIFRVREDGSAFQVIFEPTSVMDGGHHRAPAFEGSDGYIYGALGENSFGVDSVVWRIQKDGTGWQVLKRLPQNGRGTNGVVEAPDGFLYGCTSTADRRSCSVSRAMVLPTPSCTPSLRPKLFRSCPSDSFAAPISVFMA